MMQKSTVQAYMNSYAAGNHDALLGLLHDDITWDVSGHILQNGKEAYRQEMNKGNFEGSPAISATRMIEEGNIVVAEGTVTGTLINGDKLDLVFCDVFEFEDGLIKKLTSYVTGKTPG